MDLDEYLRAYTADGYPVGTIVHATCAACGGTVFALVVDEVEGYAQCVCESCRGQLHMLDSGEYENDADPVETACPCGRESFEVAVGFSLRDGGDVRWVWIALRRVRDGVLGVYADWKIDYLPTGYLLTRV